MKNRIVASVAIAATCVLMLLFSTLLVVDQRTYAVVFTRGKIQRFITSPGLYFKWPAPFSQVLHLDRRIQTLSRPNALHVYSADQKEIRMRWTVQWRITEPHHYFRHFGRPLGHPEARAEAQLRRGADTAVRTFVARQTASQLISENAQIGRAIRHRLARDVGRSGIGIIDARVIALTLRTDDTHSLPARLEMQYKQAAHQLRSAGTLEVAEMRAAAEREREDSLAQAYQQAQILKGEGDAQAAAIYASAYGRDPQFYRFYKSLEAYRKSFSTRDVIIVDPSSDFFRFIGGPHGKATE